MPAVDALLARHETTKLRDYVAQLGLRKLPGYQSSRDFIDEVSNYTGEVLGSELGAAVAEELREKPQVLTANHHGIDFFAQSTQSNLLFSLGKRSDGTARKTIPVLACGSVPLNNLTYPRGLLIYACGDASGEGEICKLPIFPDSYKRKLVGATEPFTAEMLGRARARANRLLQNEELILPLETALHMVFDDLDSIGQSFPGYSRQATVVNNRLWQRLFRGGSRRSELVYIELESIVTRLLQKDLFDKSTICHQLLFDPELRVQLIENLDGQRGCWQAEKLLQRCSDSTVPPGVSRPESALGTMFFWGVDAKDRQVPLCVVEGRPGKTPELRGIGDSGCSWSIPFTPDALARGLGEYQLVPSIFTSYLLISIARGINCIGGYYQADYLPIMKNAVIETLSSDSGAARFNRVRDLDPYLSGMQAIGFRSGDRLLPAGPLEIIACGGIDDEQFDQIGEVTVFQSHIASLFDIIMDVSPRGSELHRSRSEISKLVKDTVGNHIATISLDTHPAKR